jgi:hypothetical protein
MFVTFMVCPPAKKMVTFCAPEVGIFCRTHFLTNLGAVLVIFNMALKFNLNLMIRGKKRNMG